MIFFLQIKKVNELFIYTDKKVISELDNNLFLGYYVLSYFQPTICFTITKKNNEIDLYIQLNGTLVT